MIPWEFKLGNFVENQVSFQIFMTANGDLIMPLDDVFNLSVCAYFLRPKARSLEVIASDQHSCLYRIRIGDFAVGIN